VSDKGKLDPKLIQSPSDLVQQLRLLKLHAGDPVIRVVSKQAGVPRSTVQDLLSGKRGMPQHDNFMKVVRALLPAAARAEAESWRQAWIRAKEQAQHPQGGAAAQANQADPASGTESRVPHAKSSAPKSHRIRNVEKAEADVKALELEVLQAQMGAGGIFDRMIKEQQLKKAKDRLARVDPDSYLLY
jgi:hypothetical protein